MHDAKAFGWKVGTPEHDWEAMVETVQNHVKMLNFRYRVGLKSAQVGAVPVPMPCSRRTDGGVSRRVDTTAEYVVASRRTT